jgi:hypothetical protein
MMTSFPMTWTDLVADASPGRLASGINSELPVLLLTLIGWTIHGSSVSAIRRSQVRMISHSYVSRRVSSRLASGIRTKSSLLPLTSIRKTYQDSSLLHSVLPNLNDISRVVRVS